MLGVARRVALRLGEVSESAVLRWTFGEHTTVFIVVLVVGRIGETALGFLSPLPSASSPPP